MKGFMFSHFLRKLLPFAHTSAPTTATAVSAEGWHWKLLPGAGDVRGSELPNLESWTATGLAKCVKENPARSVYRVELPGGTVYAKHCRVWNFRAWGREVLRPAKACLEFENALELQKRGIEALEPLGWACRRPGWPGESLLLTRGVEGSVPFLQLLDQFLSPIFPVFPACQGRAVAWELGRFMARMHDAGIAHPDPHPGNLLVTQTVENGPKFTLIDVHAVRFGKPLSWSESRANLVLYNRWFQLRASRTDRLRFWRSYVQARRTLPKETAGTGRVAEVETGTLASNLGFWAGRVKRCLGSNRYFRKVKERSLRGFVVRDLPEDVLRPLLADPDAIFGSPGVRILKDSRTSTVAEWVVATPSGPQALILKRFRVRKWWEPLKNVFRRSAALRSWVVGHTLRDRWLPTPRPLAVLHRVWHGIAAEGYLLAEKVPDALELPQAVLQLATLPPGERLRVQRLWTARIARLLRTLHAHGGSHRDLKASNLILQGAALDLASAVPVFIDLVGAGTGRPVPDAQRAKELTRLNASFLRSPFVTNSERLRFLKHYLLASLHKNVDWKTYWKAIQRATAAKVARNQHTGRTLA